MVEHGAFNGCNKQYKIKQYRKNKEKKKQLMIMVVANKKN